MATAKVFTSGDSQAVHLPKEFHLEADEVDVTRQGGGLFLSPKRPGLTHFLDLLYELPEDMFEGIKDDRLPEERKGL